MIMVGVDLKTVSPYVTSGPTPGKMFFGREAELRLITGNISTTSYAVIGGRRVGKTSILQRLALSRLPDAGFRTVYYHCLPDSDYKTFCQVPIFDWYPPAPSGYPATFIDLLESPPTDRKVVLLLDEADQMIKSEKVSGWPLFNRLRALAEAGRVQFVLCGEHALREAYRDSSSPLHNFTNEMVIGRLDPSAVKALVTQPMAQLMIELEDEDALVQYIYNFTSGHPNVVQRLCHRLIERLHDQKSRTIKIEDVDAVISDPNFQRDDFLQTYWQRATALEKLISLLMSADASIHTLTDIQKALQARCRLRPTVQEVDAALQRLVDLRSILKRTATGYEFAVESFRRVVAGTITLDDMLKVDIEEYNLEKKK